MSVAVRESEASVDDGRIVRLADHAGMGPATTASAGSSLIAVPWRMGMKSLRSRDSACSRSIDRLYIPYRPEDSSSAATMPPRNSTVPSSQRVTPTTSRHGAPGYRAFLRSLSEESACQRGFVSERYSGEILARAHLRRGSQAVLSSR